jgi:stage II sporulation protein D
MTNPRLPIGAALAALLASLAGSASADAAARLTIRGAGYGHGVGMSQYGAYGMAREGWDYSRILGHYYSGTKLGVIDPNRPVRVLLRSAPTVSFSGATAVGARRLNPATTYSVRAAANGTLTLLSPKGRRLAALSAAERVSGPAGLNTGGRSYRGVLDLRRGSGGVNVINVVNLEQYVRGVVAWESPSSWPIEALKAQAVAARTYAITTSKGGDGWDQYADTRSQVYGGISAETPTTDRAVGETSGHVVTYRGAPVVTYFFSTSGGRTEDVENVWSGASQSPWLRSVEDPYDSASPRHRWKPVRLTLGQAQKKLRGLVKGRLRGIDVVQRGRSPRIVAADVVGSRGVTRVSGATLRLRFGLYDTWAFFTTVTSRRADPPAEKPGDTSPAPGSSTGGVEAGAAVRGKDAVAGIAGRLQPGRRGQRVLIERRDAGEWRRAGSVRLRSGGAYRVGVTRPGVYRVRAGSAVGPRVAIR